MLSGLSGLADRLSTFMREPMYNLGNSISDVIYVPSKCSDSVLEGFVTKVNNTFDNDVLDEVWLVLAKAIDSGKNEFIYTALKIADTLIHNCGSRFHNSCTPLFMRRLKDMIITKSKEGGADNMKVMNYTKGLVADWGNAFIPIASQGRGKVIVEGFQDMQRSGIHFPPLGDKPSWTPLDKSQPKMKEEDDFDIKAFYRKVKKLEGKIEESGSAIFEHEVASNAALECEQLLPKIQSILDNAERTDVDFCSHVKTLISMCKSIIKQYREFKSVKEDDWSDDDGDWDWSEGKTDQNAERVSEVRRSRRRNGERKQETEDLFSSFTAAPAPTQDTFDFDFLSF